MKIIKKYTAIKLSSFEDTKDNSMKVELSYGSIGGARYSRDFPSEQFDSEQEASEYAHKSDKWAKWLILPLVTFDNY